MGTMGQNNFFNSYMPFRCCQNTVFQVIHCKCAPSSKFFLRSFVLICYLKAGFSVHLLILLYFSSEKKRSTLKKDYKINQTYYLYLNIPFNKQWYIISDVMVYNRGKMLFFVQISAIDMFFINTIFKFHKYYIFAPHIHTSLVTFSSLVNED